MSEGDSHESDILFCPFCGDVDALEVQHLEGAILYPAYRVACDNCGAAFAIRSDIDEWNTRALPAVQPVTVRLVFANADATPKTTVLDVSAASVPDIMAWYGAYCSGDRYTVTVDGRNVPMDQNGEPTHFNETPKSEHDAANVLTPDAGWQPIGTAPKDRVIDLWSVEGERYPDAVWGVCGDTEGWTDANDHRSLEGFTFTNWRDRPAKPATKGGDA